MVEVGEVGHPVPRSGTPRGTPRRNRAFGLTHPGIEPGRSAVAKCASTGSCVLVSNFKFRRLGNVVIWSRNETSVTKVVGSFPQEVSCVSVFYFTT